MGFMHLGFDTDSAQPSQIAVLTVVYINIILPNAL